MLTIPPPTGIKEGNIKDERQWKKNNKRKEKSAMLCIEEITMLQ